MTHFLIIDDEPDLRFLVKYNLEKEGFKVVGNDGIFIDGAVQAAGSGAAGDNIP